ncbi:MAG TPA: MerR family transcriptional regulator [Aestuariivirga sp.]
MAKMAGGCLGTVRYWEAKGLMPPRTTGYRRLYVWADVKVALQVYIFNKAYMMKTEDRFLMFGQRMEAIENDVLGTTTSPVKIDRCVAKSPLA